MTLWKHIEKFETVIWDWNGTLLDDHEAAWRAECRLFEELGRKHLDVVARKKLFTMPVQEYYARVGFDFNVDNFAELSHRWFTHYEVEIKTVNLFAGTREILAQVREAGKQQFILSAAPEVHLAEYARNNDLLKYFHGIYGLQTKTADRKRERGRDLFREHKLNPQTTLIIGDMVHDAEVAETLECAVLLVADGHQDYETLLAKSPTALRTRFETN